jgi:hypothetical protein
MKLYAKTLKELSQITHYMKKKLETMQVKLI